MILSIKKYIDRQRSGGEKLAPALLRMAHLLLNGMAMHAVELDQSEYEEFRNDILHLDEQLGDQPSEEEAMVLTGAALKRMEDYARRITKIAKTQSCELQRIVLMFAGTVETLAAGDDVSINNLQAISKRIERATEVEDLRAVKVKLAECLEAVQQEATRRRSESATVLTKMREELATTRERMTEQDQRPRDSLTGFGERSEAERVFATALRENPNLYVGIFVVQRLSVITARFGYAAGDEVVNHFGAHLRQSLRAADIIFQWSVPCFVVALARSVGMNEVRAELGKVSNARLEKTIRAGTRVAMLPISALWSVFTLRDLHTTDDVCRTIEQFATLGQFSSNVHS